MPWAWVIRIIQSNTNQSPWILVEKFTKKKASVKNYYLTYRLLFFFINEFIYFQGHCNFARPFHVSLEPRLFDDEIIAECWRQWGRATAWNKIATMSRALKGSDMYNVTQARRSFCNSISLVRRVAARWELMGPSLPSRDPASWLRNV